MMLYSKPCKLFLCWQLFLLLFVSTTSSPPDDPVKCARSNRDCTITNSYGAFPDWAICRAGEVAYPFTEQELVAVVAEATKKQRKMKVVTKYSHSIPKLVCPDGEDGLLISTVYLNRTLGIDKSAMTMTVESGMTLRKLIEEAAKAGLALPYTPYWWGLTIGGLIATGAHGSSLWDKGSSVHEYVVGVRIVTPSSAADGYAKVRSLVSDQPDMNAVKVSLGVLGVVSQVTLKLQPLFKRSITLMSRSDADLSDKILSFGNQHEFADITWLPSQKKAIYRIDDRVSSNTSGNGKMDYIGFRSTSSLALALTRTAEETQESTRDSNGKCIDARTTSTTFMTNASGLTNNGIIFTGYPVVGPQHRLQASGSCLDSPKDSLITACPWDHRVNGSFFYLSAFTIGLSNIKSFILDVQRLRDLEPKAWCGVDLHSGILMRYMKASETYLGKQEDGVDLDITYYRSKDPMVPRLHEDVLEEVEQMALFKYGGLPHWGKNRNLAFDGVIKKYGKREAFLNVKQLYDPLGLFSSEWTDQVLGVGGKASIVKEGCALEGLCVCSEDAHCAPKKGYYCRPGRVYKDARVCSRSV